MVTWARRAQDYEGRGELSERQFRLNALMSKPKKIAEEFNVAARPAHPVKPAQIPSKSRPVFRGVARVRRWW